jgi:hypothetical protein
LYRLARIRAIGLILGLILIVAALGVVLISYFLSLDSREAVVAPERTIANTDVNPFGANFFLEREVEAWKREDTVRMAAEAGIGWAKQQFVWAEIEPQDVDYQDAVNWQRSWGKYDEIVALCERYGLQIIARLDYPPTWARQDNSLENVPPDDLTDYADFVYGFVKHYQGRVRYVQIWNEPNIYPEWGNQEVDPAGYVEMLQVAYQAAKSADPNVYVLSAPLAPTLEDFPVRRNLSELTFLEEMYQAGAADYFDILSANAFGFDLPPEDSPSKDKLNFQRVTLQREIMERYGDEHKAIWFNEYGWNASPAAVFTEEELIWKRVTEEQQAEYVLQGIEMARREWPWAGVFNIWFFRQDGHFSPDEPVYYFRMVDVDFARRKVYYAVSDAAAGLRVAGSGRFEETHPAVKGIEGWRTVIDPAASGGAYLACQSAGTGLSFKFSGDSVLLLTRRGPNGGRLNVTLDGRRVADVELYSQEAEIIRVTLVENVGVGQHTLRLTVSDKVNEASSGRVCAVDAFEVQVAPLPTFPTLSVVLLGVGMTLVTVALYREIAHNSRRWRS